MSVIEFTKLIYEVHRNILWIIRWRIFLIVSTKTTSENSESTMGILKFHNLELFLSLNEKKINPERVSTALKNLKESISMIEETLVIEKPQAEIIKLVPEKNKDTIKKIRYSSDHYFSVKNHLDLFNVGNFYFQEFQKGKKSFALYADKEELGSCETLIGLASYFNYHENLKVTIIVESFATSNLSKQLKATQREVRACDDHVSYDVIVADGVEVIEFSQLHHLCLRLGRDGFEHLIENIFAEAEISFWDFPKLSIIDSDKEFYFPLIQKIDSFSVLLARGKSKSSNLKSFLSYAKKYSMKIDGVLFDKGNKGKNE